MVLEQQISPKNLIFFTPVITPSETNLITPPVDPSLNNSRYVPPVSRAPASELVLQRGGLPSEIALPGEASSPKLCIEGWVPTLKNRKIFSANNEQGNMKRGEKWFSEKLRKFSVRQPTHSRYVPPVSRAPASELVLQRGGMPSEIALPGKAWSPKLCIEGWVLTLKNRKNIFG